MTYLEQWLLESPREEDVRYINCYPYLPIELVKKQLNEMVEMFDNEVIAWGDKDFSYFYHNVNGVQYISGTLTLLIYCKNGIVRELSGASSCSLDSLTSQGIDQFAGTINSMALSFAAKKLGNRFSADSFVANNLDEGGRVFGKSSGNEFDEFIDKLTGLKSKKEALLFFSTSKIDFNDAQKEEIHEYINSLK